MATRKLQWQVAAVGVFAASCAAIGIVLSQGEPMAGALAGLVYGSGFVATAAFFLFHYLYWQGKPNVSVIDTATRGIVWFTGLLMLLLWVRVSVSIIWR